MVRGHIKTTLKCSFSALIKHKETISMLDIWLIIVSLKKERGCKVSYSNNNAAHVFASCQYVKLLKTFSYKVLKNS